MKNMLKKIVRYLRWRKFCRLQDAYALYSVEYCGRSDFGKAAKSKMQMARIAEQEGFQFDGCNPLAVVLFK